MSDITSTEKKRRFIMFCLLGLVIAAVIVFASFALFAPEKPSATAKLAATRSEAVSGQAGGEGSEEYNKKLETHDAQQANAALQAGDSFVPTPVGQKPSVVGKKPDTPPPPPPVAPVRTAPVSSSPKPTDARNAPAPRSERPALVDSVAAFNETDDPVTKARLMLQNPDFLDMALKQDPNAVRELASLCDSMSQVLHMELDEKLQAQAAPHTTATYPAQEQQTAPAPRMRA